MARSNCVAGLEQRYGTDSRGRICQASAAEVVGVQRPVERSDIEYVNARSFITNRTSCGSSAVQSSTVGCFSHSGSNVFLRGLSQIRGGGSTGTRAPDARIMPHIVGETDILRLEGWSDQPGDGQRQSWKWRQSVFVRAVPGPSSASLARSPTCSADRAVLPGRRSASTPADPLRILGPEQRHAPRRQQLPPRAQNAGLAAPQESG